MKNIKALKINNGIKTVSVIEIGVLLAGEERSAEYTYRIRYIALRVLHCPNN
jgi:hypothetical protein